MIDVHSASLLALQTLLDGFASEYIGVSSLACEVGRRCEHEAQVRVWEGRKPGLYYEVQKYLDRTGATSRHRERVNIHKFNELLSEGKFDFGWTAWGLEVQMRVGIALIDNIVRITGWFDYIDDPFHRYRKGQKAGPKRVVVPKDAIKEWFSEQLGREEELSPIYQPTIIAPRPWDGTRVGGYWTPYVRAPRLIRFKVSQIDQREAAADEYERIAMPNVYEAVNYLQSVAWRVNRKVLDVMRALDGTELGAELIPSPLALEPPRKPKGMPSRDQFTRVTTSPDGEVGARLDYAAYKKAKDAFKAANPEAHKAWVRAAFATKRKGLKRLMERKAWYRTFKIASSYAEHGRMYFPHMLDFRGRFYPIPIGLQPQGDDAARGLLEFADGKPVDVKAAGWIAINLATQFGIDKVSFDKRLAWVEKRNETWRRIAKDPIGNPYWIKNADKPWQALAAIYDWVGWLEAGPGYVSHAPVSVDGTCNGIQHLSALTLDKVAGEHVNLVPSEKPRDIYKFVARMLQADLERIEAAGGLSGEYAAYWLDLCKRDIPRALTKRQVMVLPYGGTRESFFEYTREWLNDHDPADPAKLDDAGRKLRTARLSFMALRMWDIVGECIPGAVSIMRWLQRCAKHATAKNQPIFWTCPSGFVVRHFYGKQITKQVDALLNGDRVQLGFTVSTKDLDVKSQLQGIAPNFVHSLDASALTTCVLKAKAEGITAMATVHDAYGTHAADMDTLFRLIRESFVETHSTDMLAVFRNSCVAVKAGVLAEERNVPMEQAWQMADEIIEPVPARGDLDLNDVLHSDYFFA